MRYSIDDSHYGFSIFQVDAIPAVSRVSATTAAISFKCAFQAITASVPVLCAFSPPLLRSQREHKYDECDSVFIVIQW